MELPGENNHSLPAVIICGSIGGVCSAIVYFLLQWLWDLFLPNGNCSSLYYDAQLIVLFALIFAFLGFFAGNFFGTRKKPREIIVTGMVSGICTALIFAMIVGFPVIAGGSGDFSELLIPLAQILAGSMILQVTGAYLHDSWDKAASGNTNNPSLRATTKTFPSYRFLLFAVLVVLAILIIPPIYVGMTTEVVAEELRCFEPVTDRVEVTRTGPDSLHIVMLPDPKKKHIPVPTVNIFLDEKDVSNQSMIERSRLKAVIDPPEGLSFQKKASVTLQGRDVSGNETVPVHFRVIVTYPDRGIHYVICDMQI
jgi:hypothetical protein